MQFSLNMVLESLKSYKIENHEKSNCFRTFNECLPLPEDFSNLSKECLYIGGLSSALFLPLGICCICVRDRIHDAKETPENLEGLIIVNENITQKQLFSIIANRVFSIINWMHAMNDILLNNGTLQDIVDLCPPIIDNYIAINDASLTLLAHSKTIFCDDPICIDFVKNGYHTEEYISKFRKFNLLKTWDAANDIFIDDTCDVAKYVVVHKVFRFQNAYFAHIVMTCNRTPVTPCLLELFQLFASVVDKYIKHISVGRNTYIHIYDALMTDLIENRITKKKVIDERAQYVGLPLNGPFHLFLISPSDPATLFIGKMLKEFSETFPRFKFITYNKLLIAVNAFLPDGVGEQFNNICLCLEAYLDKYDAHCGISYAFESLEQVSDAYKQATLALKYSRQSSLSILFKESMNTTFEHIHLFSDKFIYSILDNTENNISLWYHSDLCKNLKKLYAYDKRHKCNYIELLNLYLSKRQNAAEVGLVLHTHRNNIVYHINRIKELLDVDLDSPSICFSLQLSIVLSELYGISDDTLT